MHRVSLKLTLTPAEYRLGLSTENPARWSAPADALATLAMRKLYEMKNLELLRSRAVRK